MNIMLVPAHKITGFHFTNEQLTKNEFSKIQAKFPGISFDKTILLFENAPKNITLEKFAASKQRTAEGYRKTYLPFFKN